MKILLVDDEASVRQTLSHILEDAGYTVAVASDGKAALEQALQEQHEFILYDARMPDLPGPNFLEEYHKAGGLALVIVMTAYGSNELALSLMESGAYDYLPKPFTADELVLTLQKSLARERLRRQ